VWVYGTNSVAAVPLSRTPIGPICLILAIGRPINTLPPEQPVTKRSPVRLCF
jgi:hypothetical protein